MINCFCCNLYCIVFIIISCTVSEFGDCSIDIRLFVLCCVCLFCLYVMCFFLTSFMSDCCMTEFVDLQNDMYVCMYVCTYICMYVRTCILDWTREGSISSVSKLRSAGTLWNKMSPPRRHHSYLCLSLIKWQTENTEPIQINAKRQNYQLAGRNISCVGF